MPICRLCKKENQLQKSHIIPEFLWKGLYDESNTFFGITGTGPFGHRKLQKGLREPLFCRACEQHFNDAFEKPFNKQWIKNTQMPKVWANDTLIWMQFDYATFKLFHLSILFRAHVSSLPDFTVVDLGAHAERIRNMLTEENPGEVHEYPIFGYAILHPETKSPVQIVSSAQLSRIAGTHCYAMMYGGVEWYICVASHRYKEFEKLALRSDGTIPLGPIPMDKVGSIRRTAKIYASKRT
ncbi:hypothetical protein [Pseudohongiella spirulinae]|uniref:HNH endonuclease 5 domain-containing protein n=1 Tax=Pseudohongiella spirulinae TaxID=1249552 RepID=A0A0S2K976_9GAMM|nr:hypothetical protein [Pseudohongiella spirulinae]ALO44896.1 hypothetical protein PS2015_202 [Pseudohongiella spirulinae]